MGFGTHRKGVVDSLPEASVRELLALQLEHGAASGTRWLVHIGWRPPYHLCTLKGV